MKRSLFEDKILLAIGNSRLHWAWLRNKKLLATWHTPHLSKPVTSYLLPSNLLSDRLVDLGLNNLPVYIASVVPSQTKLWQNYHDTHIITLQDVGLNNLYPTLGIDRALAAWGGGENYGYPCLIIDGGTALTFTGVNQQQQLIGGAILPGLRTQFVTLKKQTAALPKVDLPPNLPSRWATDTDKAIASGIIYTAIAGIYSYITDWLQQYPQSQIIFTGGDGAILAQYLARKYPQLQFTGDRHLIFYGMNLAIDPATKA